MRQLRPKKAVVAVGKEGHTSDAVVEWVQENGTIELECVDVRANEWGRADPRVRIAGTWQTWTRVVAIALRIEGWEKLKRSDSLGYTHHVDHESGVRTDCRVGNLQVLTRLQNQKKQKKQKQA